MPNVERLKLGLALVRAAHARGGWRQERYRCGTGMCWAGHLATHFGGTWAIADPDYLSELTDHLFATDDEINDGVAYLAGRVDLANAVQFGIEGRQVVTCAQRVMRLLDLDMYAVADFINLTNTIDDLEKITHTIVTEVENGSYRPGPRTWSW